MISKSRGELHCFAGVNSPKCWKVCLEVEPGGAVGALPAPPCEGGVGSRSLGSPTALR